MPIQLQIWERRDGGNREIIANTALEECRITRKVNGITSARYYWSGTEEIVFLIEGETSALNTLAESVPADFMRFGFVLLDNAKLILSKRLVDPKAATQTYRAAGKVK